MALMTGSTSKVRRHLAAALLGIGAVLVALGGFSFGKAETLGLPVVVAGVLAVATCSAVIWPHRLAAGTVGVLIAVALGFVTNLFGRARLKTDLRTELERLRPLIVAPHRVPDVFDVPGSSLFQRAFVSPEPSGYGHRVRLPMRDGSVVEYVSDERQRSQERRAPCSEEIDPGLYRRFRCQN